MKQSAEVIINEQLVGQLIAAQFPQWARLAIRPVELDGWDNRTFRLGETMSVRLPSAERYVAQVAKEHLWLPRLAPRLPLPIPCPIAIGQPGANYPWPWSIYGWIEGRPAALETIANLDDFATTLAQFLVALQQAESAGAPPPGKHNFFRGGSLAVYDQETWDSIRALAGEIDAGLAAEVWEASLGAAWDGRPVWVHGDVAAGNLLVNEGRLSAVIDFGCSAVGDPACDLTIAWTFFAGSSRQAFCGALPLDGATWARARGWALWKALITLVGSRLSDARKASQARRVIDEVLQDYKRERRDR